MKTSDAGFLAFCGVVVAVIVVGGLYGPLDLGPNHDDLKDTALKTDRSAPVARQDALDGSGEVAPTERQSADRTSAEREPVPNVDTAPAETETARATSDTAGFGTETAVAPPSSEQFDTQETPATQEQTTALSTGNDPVPSFGLLRVEPNGSMVVAGEAEPGTRLEILDGETVVASTKVAPSGDFAAVLDEPLPPGDYELKLRSTAKGGEQLTSKETATVSIPEQGSDGLLAMINRPGEASRIITQPEAAPESDEPAPNEGARAPAGRGPKTANAEAPAMQTATGAGQPLKGEDVAALDREAAAPQTETRTAVQDEPSAAAVRVDAVELEGPHVFIAGSANPGTTVRVYIDNEFLGESVTAENGRFLVDAERELEVGEHTIRADVVEQGSGRVLARAAVPFQRPEGEQFAAVASSRRTAVEGGRDAQTSETGESRGMAGGAPADDIAAVDLRDRPTEFSGSVPADRDGTAAQQVGQQPTGTPNEPITSEQAPSQPMPDQPTATARSQPEADPAGQTPPSVGAPSEQTAAPAWSPADISGSGTADIEKASQDGPAPSPHAADLAQGSAADVPSAGQVPTERGDASVSGQSAVAIASEEEPAATSPGATATQEQPTKQAAATVPVASESPPGSGEISSDPPTILQPALTQTDGSVIIRRGDTLWQISRRTYGRGVRYTTIYLANEDQIEDPDRIYPGQIFSVPREPVEHAEEIHRLLRNQR